jgi:hypothetical protein
MRKAYLTLVRSSQRLSKSLHHNSLFYNVLEEVCGSWFKCWVWAYYVATNGNNANPSTQAQPFQTIAKG